MVLNQTFKHLKYIHVYKYTNIKIESKDSVDHNVSTEP